MSHIKFKSLVMNFILVAIALTTKFTHGEEKGIHAVAVIKISESAVTKLIDQEITQVSGVNKMFQGTHLIGKATTTGRPTIVLRDDNKAAAFEVVFSGTTTSYMSGTHHPVSLKSHSVTQFTATKKIEFVPGHGFKAAPATIESKSQSQVDSIDTHFRGVLRRLILKRAWAETEASHAAAVEFARQSAEPDIVAALDTAVEMQLTKLNDSAEVRGVAENYLKIKLSPIYQCATQKGYLQLAISSQVGKQCKVELPKLNVEHMPVQLWLHKSLLGSEIKDGLSILEKAGGKAQEIIKQSMPLMMAQQLATSIKTPVVSVIPAASPFHWNVLEDWIIIQFTEEQIAPQLEKLKSASIQPKSASLR